MLYRGIIAVWSQIHKKHINTLCGQNVEFFNVKLVIHTITVDFEGLICIIHKFRSYRAVNTLLLGYKNQSVNTGK
jgi:hypothetical protein